MGEDTGRVGDGSEGEEATEDAKVDKWLGKEREGGGGANAEGGEGMCEARGEGEGEGAGEGAGDGYTVDTTPVPQGHYLQREQ